MSQDDKQLGGGWGSALTQLAAFAGLGRRESVSTSVKYDAHTQVFVVALQAMAAMLFGGLFLWCLWIGRGPLLAVLEIATGLDYFMAAGAFMAVGFVARLVAGYLVIDDASWMTKLLALLLSTAWHLGGAMMLLNLFQAFTSTAGRFEMALSIVGIPVLSLTAWRFLIEIFNPTYPPDKSMNLMERLVKGWTGAAPEPEPEQPSSQIIEIRAENGSLNGTTQGWGLSPQAVKVFAAELWRAGWDLAESRWGGFSPVFESYPHYREVRTDMQRQELIRKSRAGTYTMTDKGKQVFRAIVNSGELDALPLL